MLTKLVIATGNKGKLHEIQALLAPLNIEVIPQSALNVSEAPEPHCTFIENALAKARHASLATGLPALADDSGLCLEALKVHQVYIQPILLANPEAMRKIMRTYSKRLNSMTIALPIITAAWY